jgi:membrane-associated protease RseP (regulator of RpoE activity)
VTNAGYVGAVLVIVLSIMLHEAGHFLTAKRYGMKATRFFFGFGPTLWSFRRGETEYGVKAIPAGGFVKIVGMTPLEDLEPGDENRAFYRQPARQRVVVLSAGSAVHILLALLITYLVLVFVGDFTAGQKVVVISRITPCVMSGAPHATCRPGDPVSPSVGKLRNGDHILSVDGARLKSGDALPGRLHGGTPVTFGIRRDGHDLSITLTPVAVQQIVKGKTSTVARIGIGLVDQDDPPSVGVVSAVPKTFSTMGEYLSQTVQGIGRIPATIGDVLAGRQRGPNDVGTVVAATQVSGQVTGAAGVPLGLRLGAFFLLMAGLNFFIGVFNMLPLLPLDGGHVAILAFEEGRSRLYRLIGRHDPGRVDLNKVMPVTYAVFVAIVAMSAILLYADIFRPIKLNG